MESREVGRTGRAVGSIGLGCMGMSWAYAESTRDDDASIAVVREAVDAGVTFLDTADVYGDGHNETLLGRALAGRRDEVFLATKGGLVVADLATKHLTRDGRPAAITAALDASLRRLGTDHVDLYYLHRVDDDVPLEETWGAMAEAVARGKARHLGLSEVTPEQAGRAAAIHPVTAVQSELSLWTRDALDGGTVAWCRDHGAAFVPFAPLGRGFLTGGVDASTEFEDTDLRARNPRFTVEARERNAHLVATVRAIAARLDRTPAQVALAWTLTRGDHVLPIPGTRRSRHLAENVAAADVVLAPDDLAALDALPAAVGSRY